MTRTEWLGSLWSGELAVGWRVPGVSFYRRLQLAFLKFVAISGYYYGKGVSFKSPPSLRSQDSAAARVFERTGPTDFERYVFPAFQRVNHCCPC